MNRTAEIHRKTRETEIRLRLDLDGRGRSEPHTGVGFFDHMLDLLSRHSLIDLAVQAQGDLHVDAHHTVEDVGIVLGQALEQALGDKRGISRYGWAIVPMDESLAQAAVDLSGRASFVFRVTFPSATIGGFPTELVEEFFKAFANAARMNLHIHVPYGGNAHHVSEAVFKAVARALRAAVSIDPRVDDVPSTKGSL